MSEGKIYFFIDDNLVYYFGTEDIKPVLQNKLKSDGTQKSIVQIEQSDRNLKHFINTAVDNDTLQRPNIDQIQKFMFVKCGQRHVVLLDVKHNIWMWGKNDKAQLGIDSESTQKQIKSPFLYSLQRIKAFDCGGDFNIAIGLDGKKVYCWGDGKNGKLGDIDDIKIFRQKEIVRKRLLPVIYPEIRSVQHLTQITVTTNTESSIGTARGKSLKTSPSRKEKIQKKLELKRSKSFYSQYNAKYPFKAQAVFCGYEHSFIQINDKILSFGIEKAGKTGLGFNDETIVHPTIMEIFNNITIIGISASFHHSLAWDDRGALYSWGESKDGKLGHTFAKQQHKFSLVIPSPRKVDTLQNDFIVMAAASNAYSCAINSKGQLYTWGKGDYSNIQQDQIMDIQDAVIPKLQQVTEDIQVKLSNFPKNQPSNQIDVKFVKIVGGYHHQAALDNLGRVWTWGNGKESCLGHGDNEDQLYPKKISQITDQRAIDVGVGDRYTVILTVDRKSDYDSPWVLNFKEKMLNEAHRLSQIKKINFERHKEDPQECRYFKDDHKIHKQLYGDISILQKDPLDAPESFLQQESTQVFQQNQYQSVQKTEQSFQNTEKKQLKQQRSVTLPNSIQKSDKIQQSQSKQVKIQGDTSDYKKEQNRTKSILRNTHQPPIVANEIINSRQQSHNTSILTDLRDKNQQPTNLPRLYKLSKQPDVFESLDRYHKDDYTVLPGLNSKTQLIAALQFDQANDYVLYLERNNPYFKRVQLLSQNQEELIQQEKILATQSELDDIDQEKILPKHDYNYTLNDQQNEIKRYEYIQKIKQGKSLYKLKFISGQDQEIMKYILSDPESKSEFTREKLRVLTKNDNEFQEKQQSFLNQIKRGRAISEIRLPDYKKTLEAAQYQIKTGLQLVHQKPDDIEIVRKRMKSLQKRYQSPTNKQQAEFFKQKGKLRDAKIDKVLKIQQDLQEMKLFQLMKIQQEKSFDYRDQQSRVKQYIYKRNMNIKQIMKVFNITAIAQTMGDCIIQLLQKKRQNFKYNMMSRVIQRGWRNYQINKKVIKNMNKEVVKFYKNLIFQFLIKRKIKIKRRASKFIIAQIKYLKLKQDLRLIIHRLSKKIINIQKFIKWLHRYMEYQIEGLSINWDVQLLDKCSILDTDLRLFYNKKEQQNFSRNPLFQQQTNLKKQDYINTEYHEKLIILNIIPKLDHKINIDMYQETIQSKKNKKNAARVQLMPILHSSPAMVYEPLLPFSQHMNKIKINHFRFKKDSEEIHNHILPQIQAYELQLKKNLIRECILKQRREYFQQLKAFKKNLYEYIQTHRDEINMERTEIMLTTGTSELQRNRWKENFQYKEFLQHKQLQSKKYSNLNNLKQFNFIEQNEMEFFLRDHLPFGSSEIIFQIAEKLTQNKHPRPQLKIKKLTEKQFLSMLTKYCDLVQKKYNKLAQDHKNYILKNIHEKFKPIGSKELEEYE